MTATAQHERPLQSPGRLLKLVEVVRETSLHPATIYRRMKRGEFPRNYPIGGGRKVWTEREIEAWKSAAIEVLA